MNLEDDRILLIFLVRTDIRMSKGQIASKVADVTQYLIEDCIERKFLDYTAWRRFHASEKIVLRVNTWVDFRELHAKLSTLSREQSFPIKIVNAEQKIKLTEPIPIVLGFGPIKRKKVGNILDNLKLF